MIESSGNEPNVTINPPHQRYRVNPTVQTTQSSIHLNANSSLGDVGTGARRHMLEIQSRPTRSLVFVRMVGAGDWAVSGRKVSWVMEMHSYITERRWYVSVCRSVVKDFCLIDVRWRADVVFFSLFLLFKSWYADGSVSDVGLMGVVVSEVWMCAPPHRLLAEDHYSAYNGEGNLITKAMLLAEKILRGNSLPPLRY